MSQISDLKKKNCEFIDPLFVVLTFNWLSISKVILAKNISWHMLLFINLCILLKKIFLTTFELFTQKSTQINF
jgi:hypothetical protein